MVGMFLRATTEDSARPKFPPPTTATRTGYVGKFPLALIESDDDDDDDVVNLLVVVVCDILLILLLMILRPTPVVAGENAVAIGNKARASASASNFIREDDLLDIIMISLSE